MSAQVSETILSITEKTTTPFDRLFLKNKETLKEVTKSDLS